MSLRLAVRRGGLWSFSFGLCLLMAGLGVRAWGAETVVKTWDSPGELEEPTRDRFIDAKSQPGSVCSRRWVLLTDGAGDYASGGRVEGLSGKLRARKDFFIDDPNVFSAELYFFGNGWAKEETRELVVNGHPVQYVVRPARDYYETKWDRVTIPVEYLQKGMNSFVFRDVNLWIEPSRSPNRSAKSEDGGVTWDYDGLGPQNALDGEYIVRLGLERYAAQGEMTSPYIDVGALAGGEGMAPEVVVRAVRLTCGGQTPAGTGVIIQGRIGSTPSFQGDHWTPWMDADKLPLDKAPAEGWHYLQWRAILSTEDPKQTPVLEWVKLEADVEILRSAQNDGVREMRVENENIIRSSYPFAYEAYDTDGGAGSVQRFANLYRIPQLVSQCKTDFDRAVLLRKWTRKQWEYGIDPPDPIYNGVAPWDPAVLIHLAREGYSPGYCVHVSLAYTGVCEAAGLTARQFIRADGSTEVWSNAHKKWVVMEVVSEPTFHYEQNGVPLNGLEIHQLKAKRAGFDVVSVSDPPMPQDTPVFFGSISGAGTKMGGFFGPGEVRGIFDGIFIPLRNNWITSDEPAEAYHGWDYHEYDNYLWWAGDEAAPNVPWYSYRTDRVADMYWTLNQAELHPRAGAEPNTIQVDMATVTPNLDTFLVRVDGGDWVKVAPNALRTPHEGTATFPWALHPGKNTLEATTRNKFGLDGIVSTLEVEVAS